MGQETGQSMDGNAELGSLHDRIETALRDSLEEQWEEVLDQWSGAAPSARRAVWSYVAGLRNRVLEHLLALDSLEELNRGLAIAFVEMKCHWMMLNERLQRQTTQNGRPEELLYRTTCVSLIVQALEPLLSRESVEGLADVLAEPLA